MQADKDIQRPDCTVERAGRRAINLQTGVAGDGVHGMKLEGTCRG